ncbi:MAG: putative zinc-binding metallopeptidase [Dysgonamonadaceae bacterium]|jgi:substrate import-associated zinc metallohydrolase lipoprotein|nr:putative zinc-binding metallopeptidase [Dysgonamonadaceae bacterium]
MKKIIFYSIFFFVALAFFSCKEDELGPSIIPDSEIGQNVYDKWYTENFNKPYNIDVIYKLRDIDADAYDEIDNTKYGFNLVPADPAKSFALAQLMKYFWAGVYEEYQGSDFIKANGFRQIQFEGTYRYKTSTYVKATASAGIRIVFCGVNNLNVGDLKNANYITDTYMKTMYHENTHILNQKKSYPAEFGNVCGADYIGDDWNTRDDTTVYKLGFITPYAGHSAGEDFAETLSIYVTQRNKWDTTIKWQSQSGGKTDVAKMEQKLAYVRDYMREAWGIDIDVLRQLYEQREANLKDLVLLTY